ncbi:restriction endonuclease [Paenibacillus qinlingensis]|uniref:Restriction endonuclease n=1 Tax=Paenibacillus qinlingensis TaxID=1837343 RepID=A0ABU1NPU8_9BACL|nr:restriction endonuclease [Paenibacillus qinlingensis]MDR6549051.1 hypothetical protein [Paenibacillus qinlingensis]
MNRGYSGYYRETFLRSSYEYAYARYLDYFGIKWMYEERTYNLGYKDYKPDFFIYDKQNTLIKIVEVKQRNLKVIIKTKKDLERLKSMYGISAEIVSYEELLLLYKELPMSLTSTLSHWIDSEETTINKKWEGSLNPHFNRKHNENTKKYISDKTRERWKDPFLRNKMLAGSLKGAEAVKAKKGTWIKVPRVTRVCEFCEKAFSTLDTSVQRFCSDICGGKYGFKLATAAYTKNRQNVHWRIRSYVLDWTKKNSEYVENIPNNRIKSSLQPLLNDIANNYDVNDIRVVTIAVLGEQLGRKELLKFLKDALNDK